MKEKRLNRINELIHRFIGDLLHKELAVDSLVTVSKVETSPNGQESTISLTVFPFTKSAAAIKEIEKNIYEIQQKLNRGLRIRPVPKIRFEIDKKCAEGLSAQAALGGGVR
ncbi:MAG: ribosome-binding factor A [Candidatus Sungbacteria bacterium]|uniref:Ribosome-binding factor A n=1 Tax=Candidatus Sungiibacteriota bacterium TaxID=2750080 RepID=A0A9D6HU43_9BACT|nr:ribosome-binding factor A [Candidatus Sungbacteria bacterium]